MDHRKYYMTAEEFMQHLEAAVREAYFTGDNWNKNKWHPEDLAVNIEASLTVLRGFLSSVIWQDSAKARSRGE